MKESLELKQHLCALVEESLRLNHSDKEFERLLGRIKEVRYVVVKERARKLKTYEDYKNLYK